MRLAAYSIRHPKRVLVLAGALTLAVAPGALRLRLRTDGHALVPAAAPAIEVDRSIRDEFRTYDPVVLFIESPNARGIFNAGTLALVQTLTDDLRSLGGIEPGDVTSLATEHGHRVQPGTLNFRRFLDPLPTSDDALATLRDDLRAIKLYDGTLISRDERSTAILAGVSPTANRLELLAAIHELLASKGPIPESVHVIGAPAAETLLGSHILEDLGVPARWVGRATRAAATSEAAHQPSSLYRVRSWLGQHLGLVPISLGLMFVVFGTYFRSLPAAVLPLFEVGAGLVFVFGLMGWFDVPVYLTIAVLPVILTVIGVADEIHVFAHYFQKLHAQPGTDHRQLLEATMSEMARPVILTSLTTAVGFLSFAMSPIAPVQAFGIFTAIGVLFCMLWSVTAIPAALALIHPRWLRSARRAADTGFSGPLPSRAWSLIAQLAVRRRVWVIGAAALVVAASPWGLRQIKVQDSWIDGFAADSAFRQAIERFNEQFLGMHLLLVRIESEQQILRGKIEAGAIEVNVYRFPKQLIEDVRKLVGRRIRFMRPEGTEPAERAPSGAAQPNHWESWIVSVETVGDQITVKCMPHFGPAKAVLRIRPGETLDYQISDEPFVRNEILKRIEAFEEFVAAQREDTVGGVIGPGDYLKTTNLIKAGLKEEERQIPDATDKVEWLWNQYGRIRGRDRLHQVVNDTYSKALTTVFLKNANFVDVARLLSKIREYEQTQLRPHGLRIEFGGDVAVSQTLIDAIVTTQVRSLVGSVLGAFLTMVLLGRSLRMGLICIVPCSLSVLVNFAVMGWVGVPLGVATSMFAAMTLGIADDYAIHLVERFRTLSGQGTPAATAIIGAVCDTGPAIFVNALAVGLGFGVLILSQVPANARLGLLVLLSLAGCFVATILLLPALLTCLRAPRPLQ